MVRLLKTALRPEAMKPVQRQTQVTKPMMTGLSLRGFRNESTS